MSAPRVESYRFGRMVVDGKKRSNDLILLPDQVVADWWRKQGHRLDTADLEEVFDAAPEVLVVGTGAYGRMTVPQEIRRAMETQGIELRVAQTGEAWQLYNDLQEHRRAAGVFHLTC